MKEQIKKYIEDKILFENIDFRKIEDDIANIINEYTSIPKDSDNSCIVRAAMYEDGLHIDSYFKREDSKDEKFRLLACVVSKADCKFQEVGEDE